MKKLLFICEKKNMRIRMEDIYDKIKEDLSYAGVFVGNNHAVINKNDKLISLKSEDLTRPLELGTIDYADGYYIVGDGVDASVEEAKTILESQDIEYIINACDPDIGGKYLFTYIYENSGANVRVREFGINSFSDDEIKNLLLNLNKSFAFETVMCNLICERKCENEQ